jgi:mxaA protein
MMKPSPMPAISARFFLALFTLLFSLPGLAGDMDEELPPVKEGVVTIKEVNPPRSVGYTVGDTLERTITLDIKKPYKLLDTSLPIVGYERRYKGQLVGIELRDISHAKEDDDDSTTHTLRLVYQVFTNNVVAKPAILPPEIVKLQNGKEIVQYRIPSWQFAISPISIYGSVKVESDMSTFRGPMLLNAETERQRVKVLVTILALSLLGLLYVFGRHAWLPRMGGPFAKAYRQVGKLRRHPDDASLQTAVSRVHEALNKTAGHSVFSDTLDAFLAKKPNFVPIKGELEKFFGLSRQVFFEPHAQHDVGAQPLDWLRGFCRHCRDCERGLNPAK